MITLSLRPPFIHSVPGVMVPYRKAGKVDDIFRPRILSNGIFATATGYGVSFSLGGIDSEGLDRATLNAVSRQIRIANRMLPEECIVFEYLITASNPALPARPITNLIVSEQAQERIEFLKANARFKSVRLIVTLYMPGKVATEAEEFAQQSRSALRGIQNAAQLYEQGLRMAKLQRLLPDELVQIYSYLLNLDRSLMTRKASRPGEPGKKLGRVHIGLEGDYLRVGKQYCQVLSLVDRPRGTRPDLWGELRAVDCEMVWCSVWQRKASRIARGEATAVENAVGMAGADLFSAVVGGYNTNIPPPPKASTHAQENKVKQIGGILTDLDGGHYFGHWSLFGLIHSRSKEEIEVALPRIQNIFADPSEAGLLEERRGAVSAYLSCFPGQPYNVRKHWLRGDYKANLSFVYSPFVGYPWSEDLQDEYTLVYETRQGTPFFFSPFLNGNGNTIVLGGPSRGKSLNTNAIFAAAAKYGGKTFIFEQGFSFESNVRALGGSVTMLGLEYPRMSLFRGDPSKDKVFAVSQIIRLMLTKSGVAVGNDEQDAIEKAVERMFDVPQGIRRLGHLVLPPHLKPGLKRWIEGGIYGSIFDNVEDDLQFHDLQLFEFANLGDKHNDLLEVEMSWILLLCQNVIRDKKNLGVPKHIVMDDLLGKRMSVLPVLSFVLETMKADRKNLAWATLVMQSLEDLGTYAALVKNACPNTIFLGGAFDRELYAKHFRLNAKELDELESLGHRELAIKVDGEPFVAGGEGYFKVLRMNMDPAAYARATTKPSERALRDRLTAELGEVEGMKQLKELTAAYRGQ